MTPSKLARLAGAAYEPPPQAAALARDLGYPTTRAIDPPGTVEAFVFASRLSPPDVVVAVRGTDPRLCEDVWTDLRVRRAPCELAGRVHQGFLDAANELEPELRAVLASLGALEGMCTFVGHSLGAAVATIAAGRHALRGAAELVTFASPRVGDATFCRFLERKLVARRYVHAGDAITRLPPREIGFDHLRGGEHYLDRAGDTGAAGWSQFLSAVPAGLGLLARVAHDLAAHDVSLYVRALERLEAEVA